MKNVKSFSTFVFILMLSAFYLKAQSNLEPVWNAYNAHKYAEAMIAADKVITTFKSQAVTMQQKLLKKNCPCPTGAVTAQIAKECHSNWAVNDVATAYWIKGKSAAALGKKDIAAIALKKTCEFSCGRCWDPKGWFWSPCEAQ